MSDVVVYTLPSCVQCDMTKKFLTRLGVEFTVVDVSSDEAAYARIRGWGYSSAPVIEARGEHWSGFRPDRLSALAV